MIIALMPDLSLSVSLEMSACSIVHFIVGNSIVLLLSRLQMQFNHPLTTCHLFLVSSFTYSFT
jgi:hypothetical protein